MQRHRIPIMNVAHSAATAASMAVMKRGKRTSRSARCRNSSIAAATPQLRTCCGADRHAAVTARPELRDELLEVVPPIPMTEPAPTRTWLMPAIGKTYSTEREIPEDEPGDERQVAATGTNPGETPPGSPWRRNKRVRRCGRHPSRSRNCYASGERRRISPS